MVNLIFWGKKAKAEKAQQRMISAKRIRLRRGHISKWAAEAQKCDEAIAGIDEKLSKLHGPFIRAQKARLESQRLEWQGRLNRSLLYMSREKSLMASNIKHNESLTSKRLNM